MIEIKNTQMKLVSEFLSSIELGAKASRARVKLGRKVEENLWSFRKTLMSLKVNTKTTS